jgi:ankyrin repeat protein
LDTKLGGSDWSVLHLAAANGFLDTVKIALKGLDMNRINRQESHGWTPLHLAVVNGHFEVAEELLNAGASPVVSTHKRFTPLHTLVKKYLPATSNTSPKASAKAFELSLLVVRDCT